MKIAIFHDLSVSGARRVADGFSFGLKKNNSVDLFYVGDKKPKEAENYYSKIYFFKHISIIKSLEDKKYHIHKIVREILRLYFLHRIIAKKINYQKYDIVIVHSSNFFPAPFLLRLLKVKYIYYCHDINRIDYKPLFTFRKSEYPMKYILETATKKFLHFFYTSNLSFAQNIVSVSDYIKEELEKRYKVKSIRCYPGVESSFFTPKKVKKEYDLLYVGSFDYEKGEYTLFQSILRFAEKPLNVKIVNKDVNLVTDNELLRYYRKSKFVVSSAVHQALGLVPLEAGACGTVAVAVDEGGYKETVLHEKTGLLVERNAQKIVTIIENKIKNNKFLIRTGKNARLEVKQKWNWENSVHHLESIIKDVINYHENSSISRT